MKHAVYIFINHLNGWSPTVKFIIERTTQAQTKTEEAGHGNKWITNKIIEETSQYKKLKHTNQEIRKSSLVYPYTRGISEDICSIWKKMLNM